jgi:signal transduction histidine kinase
MHRGIYLCIGGFVTEFTLFVISYNFKDNYLVFSRLKKLRFIIAYIIFFVIISFPETGYRLDKVIKNLYLQIIFLNVCYIYFMQYNYLILIFITIVNLVSIIWLQIQIQTIAPFYLIPEGLGSFIFEYCIYVIKKNQVTSSKYMFHKNYMNESHIEFITNLVDVLNTMVISIRNNEVLYVNKYGIDFLKKMDADNKLDNISVMKNSESEKFINEVQLQVKKECLNKSLEKFFDSIYLDEKNETLQIYHKSNNSLSQVIKMKTGSNCELFSTFTNIGTFSSDQQIFEVYIRKPNANDDSIEILIYDITHIKSIEKTKAESKYKQKILAKIAHEFKTPLITITTLIQSLNYLEDISNLEIGTKKKLSHVMNLSNYTIYLIQDIIQYASEETRMKISLTDVNVKENLVFCYDVLHTLVDCNENKSRKVKTYFQCYEEVDDLTISTDEIKLKQILLNLISNSVKFTLSGYIKLIAKIDTISKELIVSVEDTGIGIKQENFHLIFLENIKIDLDKDYNSKGSGLGLAISKNIATSLNYRMDFDTNLGKGTQFNLRIPLINSSNIIPESESNSASSSEIIRIKNSNSIPLINRNQYKDTFLELNLDKIFRYHSNKKLNFSSLGNNNKRLERYEEIKHLRSNDIKELSISSDCNLTLFGVNYSPSDNCIVVVDDHKLVRVNTINLIKTSLKILNIDDYSILEGTDGIDLLHILRNYGDGKIKCIFTDENMEYLNGSEAVKIIRKLEQNSKINSQFIVSITAFDDVGTRSNITDSGVNTILSKPCTKTKVTEILRNIFV